MAEDQNKEEENDQEIENNPEDIGEESNQSESIAGSLENIVRYRQINQFRQALLIKKKELEKKIKDLRKFDFIEILLVAFFKDVIDFISGGFAGLITSAGMGIFLFIKLFGHGAIVKKMFLKIFIRTLFLKIIPVINWFPLCAITTIWINMQINKKIQELKKEIGSIDEKLKNLNKTKFFSNPLKQSA